MPEYTFPGALDASRIENKQVRITTAKGDIVFKLYSDTAPLTVSNFVYLAGEGYYDGLTFHRREEGFVIQGGDPSGNGTGGPGYAFEDELDDEREYSRGIVAMANRGPDTNGSQFFIMLDDVDLPKLYSIFGEVTEGMEIVDQIKIGDIMEKVVVEDISVSEPEVENNNEQLDAEEDQL
ncbi:peptidylprolyl isomerase [Patescibacteria group bacterium]|nr:peptidylprolyl isomerase [Patescibacteria group bacterium]